MVEGTAQRLDELSGMIRRDIDTLLEPPWESMVNLSRRLRSNFEELLDSVRGEDDALTAQRLELEGLITSAQETSEAERVRAERAEAERSREQRRRDRDALAARLHQRTPRTPRRRNEQRRAR